MAPRNQRKTRLKPVIEGFLSLISTKRTDPERNHRGLAFRPSPGVLTEPSDPTSSDSVNRIRLGVKTAL